MTLRPILTLALLLLLASGCVRNPGDTMNLKQHSGPVKVKTSQESPGLLEEGRHIVPVRQIQNSAYVSLDGIAKATGFTGKWLRDGSYGLGDYDAVWTFKAGERAVSVAGKKQTMPAPALKEGGEMYVPVSALQPIIGNVTVFNVQPEEVAFFPKPTQHETGVSGKSAGFGEALGEAGGPTMAADESSDASSSSLLAFAKKFEGVKYEFGTSAYSQSGTFDCSSFTQYVFDRFGVDLPRVARAQSEKGRFVARDALQAGDLLFFYVPGRFKSNETVGHVGIYMGNGNMIHASPKPEDGVQVTPIDKPYWKDTYLFARRYT